MEYLCPGGGWAINAYTDRDGHLNVFVSHKDGSPIIVGEGSKGLDGEVSARFTTGIIEATHALKGDADYDRYPETGYAASATTT